MGVLNRRYAEVMQTYLDGCKEQLEKNPDSSARPPDIVAVAIEHALQDENPKEHYLVASEKFEAMITIGKSFEELLNLNYDQEFSYTREQLIAIMDEELAILKGEKTRNWGSPD